MQRQYPFFPGFYQSPAMYPTWSNSWETSKKREEKEYDSSTGDEDEEERNELIERVKEMQRRTEE